MKKMIITTTALFACVALAGCSAGGNAPEPSKAVESTPAAAQPTPGKGNIASDGTDFTTITPEDLKLTTEKDYGFISSAGTTGDIEFVKKTDPRVKELEDYRKATHGYEVEYLIAEVDNREGSEVANMYGVNLYDPEGMKYEFTKLDDIISDWEPTTDYETDKYYLADGTELSSKEWYKLSSEGVDLSNSQKWAIDPDEKGTFILAVPVAEGIFPIEIERIAVMAHGIFDEVPAHNRLVSEYREWKAFQEEGKEWEAYDPSTAEPVESE